MKKIIFMLTMLLSAILSYGQSMTDESWKEQFAKSLDGPNSWETAAMILKQNYGLVDGMIVFDQVIQCEGLNISQIESFALDWAKANCKNKSVIEKKEINEISGLIHLESIAFNPKMFSTTGNVSADLIIKIAVKEGRCRFTAIITNYYVKTVKVGAGIILGMLSEKDVPWAFADYYPFNPNAKKKTTQTSCMAYVNCYLQVEAATQKFAEYMNIKINENKW